jgi:16S rRNA (guanine1207-N2)-methyltransferase
VTSREAVYGAPPAALAVAAPGAVQVSPLAPDAAPLEALEAASLERFVLAAPPGALERRYALAQALRALRPGGQLIALAPKDRGGLRLAKELAAFGCDVHDTGRRHHRICSTARPTAPLGLEAAIAAGGPQFLPGLALWSQPGVFSWDRLDPGSALLLDHLEGLAGRGADLGCGVGVLARAALTHPAIVSLQLIDLDRRAISAARRNIDDPRAVFLQADLCEASVGPAELDFAISNPPFHVDGREDRQMGERFIAWAAARLRPGGVLRLVANVALPYEAPMAVRFSVLRERARRNGFKVLEGSK